MLTAEGITIRIGGKTIVEGVTAHVAPGEVLAILGPNGAGKSTLLRVLSGETEPDTGTVLLEGSPVSRSTCRNHARQRGVMPQQSSLSFPFTALEVALMGRTPHQKRGVETQRDVAIAAAALQKADVYHLHERSYPTLSGGEQQRVHFARVLAQIWEAPASGGRYLLLDEPTSSLDLAHQHETLSTARDLAAEGVGVAVVLHDLNLAAEYADHILLMKNGRLHSRGTPAQVLTSRNIEEVYGLRAIVRRHPDLDCPLVITCSPRSSARAGQGERMEETARTGKGFHGEERDEHHAPAGGLQNGSRNDALPPTPHAHNHFSYTNRTS